MTDEGRKIMESIRTALFEQANVQKLLVREVRRLADVLDLLAQAAREAGKGDDGRG